MKHEKIWMTSEEIPGAFMDSQQDMNLGIRRTIFALPG
jgi:hypothetical protein